MRIVFISTLLLIAILGFSQGLEFYREDISFKLENQIFTVDGVYYFCNTSSDTVRHDLLYPFPEDKTYLEVDSIIIVDESTGSELSFISSNFLKKGVYFYLELLPYSTTKIRICYEQKITGNKAEYILTSTNAWGKPFEVVNYELYVAPEYENLELSYPPDSIDEDKGTYYWQKWDFMPDRNFIIRFKNDSKE